MAALADVMAVTGDAVHQARQALEAEAAGAAAKVKALRRGPKAFSPGV